MFTKEEEEEDEEDKEEEEGSWKVFNQGSTSFNVRLKV